jgi:excisionase family DNA binding protein
VDLRVQPPACRLEGCGDMSGVPRVTLTKQEAADALGVSLDSFERHVLPHLRVVRCGRRVLIRLEELRRWAEENEALMLVGESR